MASFVLLRILYTPRHDTIDDQAVDPLGALEHEEKSLIKVN